MGQVTEFRRVERTDVNPETLAELEISLGPQRCQEVLIDVCVDLIEKGEALDHALEAGDYTKVSRIARAISGLSIQVGLGEYSRAAMNLSHCATEGDEVALAAVYRRLRRLNDTALFAVLEEANLADL